MADEMPHDLQAEQSTIGAVLHSADVLGDILGVVDVEDFYRPAHATILSAYTRLLDRGDPVDITSVIAELDRHGELARVGGHDYLHTLLSVTPSAGSGGHYARIVSEKATARRFVVAALQVLQMARGPVESVERLTAAVQDIVYAASRAKGSREISQLGDLLAVVLDEIEADAATDGLIGIPTGFADLDEVTGGFRPGELWVVAARPSVGKSMFGMDIARHAAIRRNIPAAYFSLEMRKNDLVKRLLAAEARVPLHDIRSGKICDDDWGRLSRRLGEIAEAPLFLHDSPGITVAEIRTKARRLQSTKGLQLLVVDYLQLMGSSGRLENRQQEVSNISLALKHMALQLGITVVALSQLNRTLEQRADKRPQMHDIRESGSIEQDADGIIMLYREELVEPETSRLGEADLILEKNRSGAKGTITVAFQGHYSRFVDMAN
ncbi:replicative DNA helicase [Glutamicibacter sp. V16R2B1]|uniref:replicative DNA helicase n=1 Tax=Glutamicibacter sp. V16R2B1 TaxID=2036207 RepID=UPI0010FF0E3D|nr:replicative DNA helicase [Glutamicibacter sp. V16R2B1]MCK9901350.1 replicative DNA helicase [Frankia sp. Cpl3]TLK47799.1 replicative DNA helicase [Glutamicibacter sp. V16R2B1]